MKARYASGRRFALAGAWAALIFVLSSRANLPGPGFPYGDKILHAGEFGVLAWLLARALLPPMLASRRKGLAIYWVAGVSSLIYALSDEMHQAFVPGRSCEISDLLADSAGILLALVLMPLYLKWRRLEFPP